MLHTDKGHCYQEKVHLSECLTYRNVDETQQIVTINKSQGKYTSPTSNSESKTTASPVHSSELLNDIAFAALSEFEMEL